jgi:hypothetical protein
MLTKIQVKSQQNYNSYSPFLIKVLFYMLVSFILGYEEIVITTWIYIK